MAVHFETVAILGGGLLGGSLALALQDRGETDVRLWVRRETTANEALARGVRNVWTGLADAICGAELLVLAVPVGAMPDLVRDAISAGLPNTAVVTDVGSVKLAPHVSLRPILAGHGAAFIGSHPMAGSEQNGIGAADSAIFSGAACLLTNDENISPDLTEKLEEFWSSLGCRTTWMGAAEHDELVARISHLPHLVAAATALVSLRNPQDGSFGGGGLRDTTRVASGNPEMWAEIVSENRRALAAPLRDTIRELQRIAAMLESDGQDAARQWLESAKHHRDALRQGC